MCLEARGHPWELCIRAHPPRFMKRGLSLASNSPSRPHWLSREPQGSSCLCLPYTWILSAHHCVWFLFVHDSQSWKFSPRAYMASTSLTEPSPQSQTWELKVTLWRLLLLLLIVCLCVCTFTWVKVYTEARSRCQSLWSWSSQQVWDGQCEH